MWTRPSRASGSGAGRGSGRSPPRPSRPRPIASCGRTGRRAEEIEAGAFVPARNDPSAGLGGRRVAEAAHRRAAGHGEDEARLRPARMAEAARAQRGAGLPGLCPRRRVDPRGRPLVGGALGRSGGAARDRRRAATRRGPRPARSAWSRRPVRRRSVPSNYMR